MDPNNIPVIGYDKEAMGKPVQAQDWIALCLPSHGYILLSGGPGVRTNVTTVGVDEKWSIDWRGDKPVFGVTIGLEMPKHGNIYLSGGPSVRTNTTNFNIDEQWQLVNAAYNADHQPILYGSFVTLQMPAYDNILLSGGSSVRTNTTTANIDEWWRILKLPPS